MNRMATLLGRLPLVLLVALLVLPGSGCAVPDGGYEGDGGGYSDTREDSACGSCEGSGCCNTCNGTGRFLGFGDTGCSTCSATGVCINCGGRGR